jgi:hypothetical protein
MRSVHSHDAPWPPDGVPPLSLALRGWCLFWSPELD